MTHSSNGKRSFIPRLFSGRPQRLRQRVAAVVTAIGMGTVAIVPTSVAATPRGPTAMVAPDEGVDAIVAEAVEKFQAKEYDEAVALFEQAYELSPEPNYLFNIGRVYEQAGQLEKAVEFYGRFVKLGEVDLGAREVALERLRVLRGVLEETKPPPDPTEDPVGDPTEEPENPPEEPIDEKPKKPNGMRIAGFVLLGVGAAGVGAGGVFGAFALQRKNDLDTLNTLEPRDNAVDRGKRNALAADILFGVGGAVLVTGVVLVALSYSKKGKAGQRAAVVPSIGRRGVGIAAEVRF